MQKLHLIGYVMPNRLSLLLGWISRQQLALIIAAFVVTTLIAASWLVFPYFVKGQGLLSDIGGTVKQERLLNSISIGRFLTRSTFGKGEAQVDILFATPRFFEVTDRASIVSTYRPDLYHVFIVTETTHIDDLPNSLPSATLTIDGQTYTPEDIEGPLKAIHHRSSTIRFSAYNDNGEPTVSQNTSSIQLELIGDWDPDSGSRTAAWEFPLDYPQQLGDQGLWTPLMVLGLSAGLLSFVLTPCLIQLLAVYLVTLTGFSADQFEAGSCRDTNAARRSIFTVGISFAIGFSLLFTLTGAAIGHAGKAAQMFFAIWSPSLTVLSGILVIMMGLWVGIRSRSPVVCRLVSDGLRSKLISDSGSRWGAGLTAVGVSLGCLTCFGGAIIATLLVYVGALGSAFIGAMVMFTFSMGIVLPFLLAAFFLSHTLPVLERVQQYAPYIGLCSMLVIVAFGIILVTDNFHVVSDFIYPYLGLR